MRRSILILVAALAKTGLAQCPPVEEWIPTFREEFDGAALNPANWRALNIAWPHNNEQQYYSPSAATVADGKLTILSTNQPNGGRSYTSARIESGDRFFQKFGRFEMRAKLPSTQGIWPAFWLLPQPDGWPPEIDIMEFLGHDPHTVYFTNHWGVYPAVSHLTFSHTGPDFSADFHTFSCDWFPDRIEYSVDGVVRATSTTAIPQGPMYVILNTAVGGFWPGYPDATTVFPQRFIVEYVRAYRKLVNGDFQSMGPDNSVHLYQWSKFGNAYTDNTRGRSGGRAGKLFGNFTGGENFSGAFQELPTAVGDRWRASAWWVNHTTDRMQAGNEAFTKLEFVNAQGNIIQSSSTLSLTSASATNTYAQFLAEGVAPAGSVAARVSLVFRQTGLAAGAAFFDDVQLVRVPPCCVADRDDGSGLGIPDGGVTIDDVLYYLAIFEQGGSAADLDNGSSTGTPDGGVTIDDLIYFLVRYEAGC
jgi:beta-glucanase (GH16 family)